MTTCGLTGKSVNNKTISRYRKHHELKPNLSKHDWDTTISPLPQPESCVVLSDRFASHPSPPHFLLASPHLLPPPTMRLLPHENCDSYAHCQTENSHRRQDRQKQGLHMQSSCVIILLRECVKCGNGSLSCRWHRVNCGGELWQKQWVFMRGTKSGDDFFFWKFKSFFSSHLFFSKEQ